MATSPLSCYKSFKLFVDEGLCVNEAIQYQALLEPVPPRELDWMGVIHVNRIHYCHKNSKRCEASDGGWL